MDESEPESASETANRGTSVSDLRSSLPGRTDGDQSVATTAAALLSTTQ